MLQAPEVLNVSSPVTVCDIVVLSANWSMVGCAGVVFHFALLWTDNRSEARPFSDCYGDVQASPGAEPATQQRWTYEYESGSDSDEDRPDPDLVLDDLASRRFHSPSPAPPTNFALPVSPVAVGRPSGGRGGPWPKVTMTPSAPPQQNVTFLRSENMKQQCDFDVPACRERTRMLPLLSVCLVNCNHEPYVFSTLSLTSLQFVGFLVSCLGFGLQHVLMIFVSLEEWIYLA